MLQKIKATIGNGRIAYLLLFSSCHFFSSDSCKNKPNSDWKVDQKPIFSYSILMPGDFLNVLSEWVTPLEHYRRVMTHKPLTNVVAPRSNPCLVSFRSYVAWVGHAATWWYPWVSYGRCPVSSYHDSSKPENLKKINKSNDYMNEFIN